MTAPGQSSRTTACPFDCPDTCGMSVTVDGAGGVTGVRGNRAHPWSRGSLCGKTARYADLIQSPDRLRVPLVRRASGFEEASWDEALGVVVDRLEGVAGDDVLALNYAGNMGLVQRRFPMRLMHALGATGHDNGVCDAAAEAGFAAVNGRSVGPDLDEESTPERCDLFVLWGSDARRTTPHLMPRLKALATAGVPVFVIDVYRTETLTAVESWGGHGLVVHPGSDGALALGLAMRAFEERAADLDFLKQRCVGGAEFRAEVAGAWPEARVTRATGLSAGSWRQLSDALHAAKRPLIKAGIGFARRRNGGENMRAVASLAAVLGWSERLFFQTGDHFGLDDRVISRPDIRRAAPGPAVSQVGLGRELASGRFGAAFVWGHNPAATLPDSRRVRAGLERDDLFVVVHELFMTETARRADVVLPATAVTEHSDVFRSYGHRTLQVGWRSSVAPADQRSNVDCFAALGRALGFVGEAGFPEPGRGPAFEVDEDVLVGELLAANRSRFSDDEYRRAVAGEPVKLAPRSFEGVGTPSGRIELASDAVETAGGTRVATWTPDDGAGMTGTFQLLSTPSTATHNSTFIHVARHRARLGAPRVHVHPEDLRSVGVDQGQPVRLRSEFGAVTLTAASDERLPRKTVRVDGFLDEELVPERIGINAVTSPEVSDHGGGNVLYSARVELERVEGRA